MSKEERMRRLMLEVNLYYEYINPSIAFAYGGACRKLCLTAFLAEKIWQNPSAPVKARLTANLRHTLL